MFEGKKVAFVASGGGGKGIAHGGVLKACESLGIKFDLLIGASSGAICVAFYSEWQEGDRVIDMFRGPKDRKFDVEYGWHKMVSFKNFFSSKIKSGIFDMAGAEDYFNSVLPVNDFRRLKIPTYISATNINTGSGELFGPGMNESTPIAKVTVASCCIPMIFRPVRIGSQYYIDGEIKRPTAVNSACELGADVVIVSDIYRPYTKGIENSSMFNIASQMTSMLFEDKSKRGVTIASARFPSKKIILISPSVGDISSLNTKAWKRLSNMGYNAAIRTLQNHE